MCFVGWCFKDECGCADEYYRYSTEYYRYFRGVLDIHCGVILLLNYLFKDMDTNDEVFASVTLSNVSVYYSCTVIYV